MDGSQYFDPLLENPNFSRYGTDGEITITTSAFISRKNYWVKFSKNAGVILDTFCPYLGKNYILEKRLLIIRHSIYLPSCKNSGKN